MGQKENLRVFISYAREDIEEAKRIYSNLKEAGVKPWMDEFDIDPGQTWKSEKR